LFFFCGTLRKGLERDPSLLTSDQVTEALVRHLKPLHIIESGAYKGLGTWIVRQVSLAPHTPSSLSLLKTGLAKKAFSFPPIKGVSLFNVIQCVIGMP
jgi:hypothetical protein